MIHHPPQNGPRSNQDTPRDDRPVRASLKRSCQSLNNIISRMMLGFRCSGEDEWGKGIRSVVREATEIIATFNLSDFIWFFRHIDVQGIKKRAMNIQFRFDTLLEKIIKEREQVRRTKVEKSSKDFLDMLLDLSRRMRARKSN
ncbi:hypothetical protein IFM89_005822 [Coptis chinensis]|uniref:Cytochrome P450 n=1 Tax=Coptis chinensis TaxID=261450 RepID=A0A835GZ44_9MAGN|nr:hypothetical protein IFM89_005822 [Coptis chinensis]